MEWRTNYFVKEAKLHKTFIKCLSSLRIHHNVIKLLWTLQNNWNVDVKRLETKNKKSLSIACTYYSLTLFSSMVHEISQAFFDSSSTTSQIIANDLNWWEFQGKRANFTWAFVFCNNQNFRHDMFIKHAKLMKESTPLNGVHLLNYIKD